MLTTLTVHYIYLTISHSCSVYTHNINVWLWVNILQMMLLMKYCLRLTRNVVILYWKYLFHKLQLKDSISFCKVQDSMPFFNVGIYELLRSRNLMDVNNDL